MSDKCKPKIGDRVRVVLEGEVSHVEPSLPDSFYIGSGPEGSNVIFPGADHVVSVEKLPDPEPEWQPGDVVLDNNGNVWERAWYERTGNSWLRRGYDEAFKDVYAVRPLALLVRRGKPVTDG